MEAEPREILVRAPNWAGDVVMATPGLRALRAAFPRARISVALRAGLEGLLEGSPRVDERIVLRHDRGSLAARLREAAALRSRRFDLGISLPDSFSAALFLRVSGARRVVGYARNGRSLLLHHPVALPEAGRGRVMIPREAHVLRLMEAVGARSLGTTLELFVTSEEEGALVRLLADRGVDPARPVAVLAPGASFGASKRWPIERFAEVGDALAGAGASVVWVGAPAESALAQQAVGAMRARSHDLTRALGLGGLKALLRRSRVLVCNDAGARHVAAAFGVPCVMLLGPTSLEKTRLNLERVRVLVADDVSCRPCYLRTCPIDHRCMTRIPPERAIAAALPALREDAAFSWCGDASADGVRGAIPSGAREVPA